LAIDKDKKQELVGEYRDLLSKSQGIILGEYRAMPMGVLNGLRTSVRNSGGALRATKNTLAEIALRDAGMAVPKDMLVGSTIIGFCHSDISAVAKAMLDFAKDSGERFSVKGGVMGKQVLSPDDVKALATLPPLPVVRAQLLGLLQAPASRLAGVLAAPGRQIATVLKAYADKAAEAQAVDAAGADAAGADAAAAEAPAAEAPPAASAAAAAPAA
jgi:large subunit ribosomal protein L10